MKKGFAIEKTWNSTLPNWFGQRINLEQIYSSTFELVISVSITHTHTNENDLQH